MRASAQAIAAITAIIHVPQWGYDAARRYADKLGAGQAFDVAFDFEQRRISRRAKKRTGR